jgi:hypothetical protein
MRSAEAEVCQWCSITDEARESAPKRSLLTLSLAYGIDKGLPFVFDGMEPRGHSADATRQPIATGTGGILDSLVHLDEVMTNEVARAKEKIRDE